MDTLYCDTCTSCVLLPFYSLMFGILVCVNLSLVTALREKHEELFMKTEELFSVIEKEECPSQNRELIKSFTRLWISLMRQER